MIVVCPGCSRQYRIPPGGSPAARVRCRACGRVFAAAESAGLPVSAIPPQPGARGGAPHRGGPDENAPLVLVGDEDREFRDLVRRSLVSLGCRVEVTSDGEAAFRFAVARHPALMVLNVYMTRLLGVAVCEGVKGSPDLRKTRVALVGSVFKSDRFIRHPGNLYGADDYFEDVISEADLRARLAALLRREEGARSPAGSPGPGGEFGTAMPGAPPDAGQLAPNGADEPIDPVSEIHRLARIMVSDLKIYHPDLFRRALVERRFSETFREELGQAKELIAGRFPGMPERLAVLTEALREQIAAERAGLARRPAGPAP